MFMQHSSPCLHLLAMFYIQCNSTKPVVPEDVYFFCFCSSITLTYGVSMLTFIDGSAIFQSANTPDADEDSAVLKLFCFSRPPTIVDEQFKMIFSVSI
jgi:hypothetical protein